MIKRFLIRSIRFYSRYISPVKSHIPFFLFSSNCKYTPTCSQYAIEALEKYGVVKGSFLAVKRILRCNPFAKGGYDPVP
ncbi:MAG: membrane protein insertion efficiency factor YidD [Lachnospiraceae bacterium]|nr:membrane protein insertion efficiency factor YidD [Lachnospiraceae bacterium]